MSKWIVWWPYGGEKTAVTYKCQKRFLRRLGTYKCQSELSGDHMVVKKRRLPINVKNGFWDVSVPINVKVNLLVTKNWKKLPLNPKVRNYQTQNDNGLDIDIRLDMITGSSSLSYWVRYQYQARYRYHIELNIHIKPVISVKVNCLVTIWWWKNGGYL